MTHDELRELTGAYALGALNDADRHALEAHLPTCGECAREVRELAAAAGGLAFAVPQTDPPAALRARVLAAATATARVQPIRTPPAEPSDTPARGAILPTWFAAAAAIAAVALGLYAVTLRERVGRLEEQLRDANARAEGVDRQLQIAQAGADRARQIAGVLDAPDVRAIELVGQKGAPAANGLAHWSPSRGLVFTAANLPAPAPGRQYQLWVIPPGSNPVSAGLLDFQDGRSVALVDAAIASSVGTVAVTLEPAGGVPQPTSDPILVGSL